MQLDEKTVRLWEPRGYWTCATFNALAWGDGTRVPVLEVYNSEPYYVELHHVLLSPTGALFREGGEQVAGVSPVIGDPSALAAANLVLEHLDGSSDVVDVQGYPMLGRQEPGRYLDLQLSADPSGTRPDLAGDMLGVSQWQFDRPLHLGRRGAVEFALTGWFRSGAQVLGPAPPFLEDYNAPPALDISPEATIAWVEQDRSMRFGRKFRRKGPFLLRDFHPDVAARYEDVARCLAGPLGFSSNVSPQASRELFPLEHDFRGKDYRKQEDNRGLDAVDVVGFTVTLNQLLHDVLVVKPLPPGPYKLAPFSWRVGTRARTTFGGTGRWWWKPGCPLALVAPTLGAAMAWRLPQPITLAPGEGLNVLLAGAQEYFAAQGLDIQVGVSVLGYAAVTV